MIKRAVSELHFVSGREPLPTVEVQVSGLESQGLLVSQVIFPVLTRFAAANATCRATVYMYGTMSVNFHEQSWSEFLIVAGDKSVLKVLESAFSNIPKVNSRYSDYIAPKEGIKAFHVEDGRLWEPEDMVTWYSRSPEETVKGGISVAKPVASDDDIEDDDDVWADMVEGGEPELVELASDTLTIGRAPEQAARFRVARSDASVASIRQSVEKIFGLPEGSVALCGPDGRALRGDAYIKTLRRKWENG